MKIYIIFFFLLVGGFCLGKQDNKQMEPKDLNTKFQQAREQMVRTQIEDRGVVDSRVLAALRKVARHLFVPAKLQGHAYEDTPLPIGNDQTISQPYIVALMTEKLALKGHEKVLEIGTGSGYQAAVLGELAREVYTIEIVEPLCEQSRLRLHQLGYQNVQVRCGDGYVGWPEQAPFDGIMVTAAPDHIPNPLVEQLKPGGRMIIPVGDYFQELVLIKKDAQGKITRENVIPVRFVPMTGKAEKRD